MNSSRNQYRLARDGVPGFTLIELVVVIGIIGVLTGLLPPALSLAKERGRRLSCMTNMRQLTMAALAYAHGDSQNSLSGKSDFEYQNLS